MDFQHTKYNSLTVKGIVENRQSFECELFRAIMKMIATQDDNKFITRNARRA